MVHSFAISSGRFSWGARESPASAVAPPPHGARARCSGPGWGGGWIRGRHSSGTDESMMGPWGREPLLPEVVTSFVFCRRWGSHHKLRTLHPLSTSASVGQESRQGSAVSPEGGPGSTQRAGSSAGSALDAPGGHPPHPQTIPGLDALTGSRCLSGACGHAPGRVPPLHPRSGLPALPTPAPLPLLRGGISSLPHEGRGWKSCNWQRSEERRVGKECLRLCRSRWSPYH